jgi:phage baseplate assembly protein gpV
MSLYHGFQPRAPKGSPGGGQFTAMGQAGPAASLDKTLEYPDGSKLQYHDGELAEAEFSDGSKIKYDAAGKVLE